MSAALPTALRTQFQAYFEDGLSGRAAAIRLRFSAATDVRWQRKLRVTGSVTMEVNGRPPGRSRLAAQRALLEVVVAQDGDMTLTELSGALKAATGIVAHAAFISRFLRKDGYAYKKVTGRDRATPSLCKTLATG